MLVDAQMYKVKHILRQKLNNVDQIFWIFYFLCGFWIFDLQEGKD